MKKRTTNLVPVEPADDKIIEVRGHKIMLSQDLAKLYGVSVGQLNQAVKRNRQRFPLDFMFQLSEQEFDNLKSQFVTPSWGGARRSRPYAFTEQGVAMLSAVLNSPTAIAVSIEIMRAFARLRQLLSSSDEFRKKFEAIVQKLGEHDQHFAAVFEAMRAMMEEDEQADATPKIGFQTESKASRAGKLARRTITRR